MKLLLRALSSRGPRGRTRLRCRIDSQGCIFCGGRCFEQLRVMSDELVKSWELSTRERRWFDQREGNICTDCRMSRRVRMLLWSLRQIYPELDALDILHLNQINHLSQALTVAASLVETVHVSKEEPGRRVGGLVNQDFTQLTYPDARFDLVIHSETLEHLHDYEKALNEAHRVLKPGGYQIYSIPLLHHRATRKRLDKTGDGELIYLLPPSWHGLEGEDLVVWELGGDFIRERKESIYAIHYDNFWGNRTVFSIIERKRLEPCR